MNGQRVLLTRPAGQSETLARMVIDAGAEAVMFPAISIQALADDHPGYLPLSQLAPYALAIFISQNAVGFALDWMQSKRREIPGTVLLAAIGPTTAMVLASRTGRDVVQPSHRFDSDALLALPCLHDVAGQRILIVRGVGGRERLREVLVQRAASVDYAEVYQRVLPEAPLRLAAAGEPDQIHVIVASSAQTLSNLTQLVKPTSLSRLFETPLLVPGERLLAEAQKLGFTHCQACADASDDSLIDALKRKFPRTST